MLKEFFLSKKANRTEKISLKFNILEVIHAFSFHDNVIRFQKKKARNKDEAIEIALPVEFLIKMIYKYKKNADG